ncbi:MAG TPA: AraC family transcriptional regulator [Xanthobacteraceae bacterium]|nr:AraC family transcriptional regulator [Xanthobacteraceae bacterium]
MALVTQVSTDELPPAQRFAHWREVRARNIFGVTVELDRAERLDFHGNMTAIRLGSASLVEMHSSSYGVERSESDISRTPGDSLCIYQQLDGGSWFRAGGREFVVSAGDIATNYTDLPYATRPDGRKGFHLRILKVPLSECRHWVSRESDLWAAPLAREHGPNALLADLFTSFAREAPKLDAASAELTVRTLVQLALIARGQSDRRSEEGRTATREAMLSAARRHIDKHSRRGDLSATRTAAALGISVRQLHLLFEPTGTTFAGYLRATRLEQARAMLLQFPERPVTDVAYSCGWNSLATFHRVFRATYGQSPGDLRDR